jgi:hypothetical protein
MCYTAFEKQSPPASKCNVNNICLQSSFTFHSLLLPCNTLLYPIRLVLPNRAGGFMVRNRTCKACDANEADNAPFPIRGLLCRKCAAAKERRRYNDNKGDIIADKKQYYKDNKGDISARHALYHKANKEHINAQDRQQYAEKVKEKSLRHCIDCGDVMPKHARKYCKQCKTKHDKEAARLGMEKLRRQRR